MVNKLTDEQRQMVADNHNLIYSFLNKYHLPDDDWYDTAAFGLINAAISYNGTAAFSTFAYKCMFNEMRNELVWRDRHKKDELSLNHEYETSIGDICTLEDMLAENTDFTDEILADFDAQKLIAFFESRLRTDCQRKQLKLLTEGVKPMDVAKQCGVSKQQVYLLRKNLLEEYRQIFRSDGTVKPAVVGGKIRIANNPYLFDVMARNDRFIVCTRKYNTRKNLDHIIIDLKDRIYGDDGGESGRYNTVEMCQTRLKELQEGRNFIANNKKLDFYVA